MSYVLPLIVIDFSRHVPMRFTAAVMTTCSAARRLATQTGVLGLPMVREMIRCPRAVI